MAERTGELLLEIGFEEMPAPWLPALAAQLSIKLAAAAERESLDPRDTQTYHTPRRLVLRADVLLRQPDRQEQIWGPAAKIAKDATGNWTKAAEGFAKKNGIPLGELRTAFRGSRGVVGGMPAAAMTEPAEEYLVHDHSVSGQATTSVLPVLLSETLRALTFPKRMNWDAWLDDGKGAFPFGRPIRWLILMLDGTVIPFVIYELEAGTKGKARVHSGPATFGHRFLPRGTAGKPLGPIRSFDELSNALHSNYVLLDPEDRQEQIQQQLDVITGGGLIQDHSLRVEWRDLVEYPTVVAGDVPPEFRQLPNEVLATVLVHHQKYIPLNENGVVTRFAAVTNTDSSSSEKIVSGMERVVVARLRDAAFFYAEDRKRPLAERVPDLSGVTFHKGLGTYLDKTERVVRLVQAMGPEMGLLTVVEAAEAATAARLAKTDLVTLMVREFPELQGTMGGIYLRAQGGPEAIANAVGWHYQLGSTGGGTAPDTGLPLPQVRIAAAVALADRIDTLVGYFGIGLSPTGSSDPFGLRRAALAVIRILLEYWQPLDGQRSPDILALIKAAVLAYGPILKAQPKDAIVADVNAFLLERLAHEFRASGAQPDEVEAVLGTPDGVALRNVKDAQARLEALHRVRKEAPDDFAHLAVAFKRAKNILTQQAAASSIEPTLFEHDAERELHRAVASLRGLNGDYDARLKSLSALRAPVDRFFDDVLVMAEDLKVRGNRLALLNEALSLFYRIADISKLGGQS